MTSSVSTSPAPAFDVVVLGEVLVELSVASSFHAGEPVVLGFSGDALNIAAASAAAGARTGLLARVPTDDLGDALCDRIRELGVDTGMVRRVPDQHGVYFVAPDPTGKREFVYVRRGSAGSKLSASDVMAAGLEHAKVVVATGVTAALSKSAREAVLEAARRARRLVYDPNYRPRLTSGEDAAQVLAAVAPQAVLVTPAHPVESRVLLNEDTPEAAAVRCRALGAATAAVTCGADGVLFDDGQRVAHIPAFPAPTVVDQTGAGDTLTGSVAARLALGDDALDAVLHGMAAASLSVKGRGGTGRVPTFAETRRHLSTHRPTLSVRRT